MVAIAASRTPALIAGLLAIVKAGGAYLPLDAALPGPRVAFMLHDAAASLVLASADAAPTLRDFGVPMLRLDPSGADLEAESGERLVDETGPATLAYVMYTSGSTGTPKGVAIEQRGVIRLVRDTTYARFGSDERMLQLAPLSFDASTFEIWGALLNGGCLVQVPAATASLGEIARTIVAARVTTLWLTAGLFQQMVDHELASFAGVRQLLAGGDVLSVAHVRRFRDAHPRCRLINGYGPTEGTTFSCTYEVAGDAELEPSVPIGRPIANTDVHVLDAQLRSVGIGMAGELCIGGAGLARGYLNLPDLTAERFVLAPGSGRRLYRTGDLVRFRPDGALQFLGRLDRQLKLRGFRIEPGEIETALLAHRAVKQAVASLHSDDRGGARLVVHCVLDRDQPGATSAALLEHLRQRLPAYMLPAAIGFVPALPLTVQGKIDIDALPAIDAPAVAAASRAPRDALERELVELWKELLGVTQIGIDDDFFANGGHSLLAARLFAHLDRRLAHPLPLATIFDAPTIAALAERVRDADAQRPAWPETVRMHAVDARAAAFRGPRHRRQRGGAGCAGAAPGRRAVADRVDRARARRARDAAYDDRGDRTRPHREIRALQPEGPYDLFGACIGGVVAYEIAQQLTAAGERIGHLMLLDPAFRGVARPGAERREPRDRPRPARARGVRGRSPARLRRRAGAVAGERLGRLRAGQAAKPSRSPRRWPAGDGRAARTGPGARDRRASPGAQGLRPAALCGCGDDLPLGRSPRQHRPRPGRHARSVPRRRRARARARFRLGLGAAGAERCDPRRTDAGTAGTGNREMNARGNVGAPAVSAASAVAIWRVDLDAWNAADEALLAADERARASRFLGERLRRRFITGRAALRRILGARLGIDPARLVFDYGTHGKPALAAGGRTMFNVSHSGGVMLCAVAEGRRLGVDIEKEPEGSELMAIARRYFSARELAELEGAGPAELRRRFTACWTRKEAAIKATGLGVSTPLAAFSVPTRPGALRCAIEVPEHDGRTALVLESFDVGAGFAAAIAAEGEDWSIVDGPTRARIRYDASRRPARQAACSRPPARSGAARHRGGDRRRGAVGTAGSTRPRAALPAHAARPALGCDEDGYIVAALGLVGSRLMMEADPHYVPYVAVGMVVWTFMLETTGEFTALFTSRGHLIRQIKLPYTLLVCIALWRHFLIMLHHFVIVAVAMVIYGVKPTAATPLALVGLVALVAVLLPWGLIAAIACARFRDLQPLVASVLQIAFFVTPVFWMPGQLSSGAGVIVGFNPAYYLIELVRSPLLGRMPDPLAGWWCQH